MRRALAFVVAFVAAGVAVPSAADGLADPPSRLLVTASEWNLVLSRAELDPGEAIVQLYNRGEDPHNLRIRRQAGGAVRRVAEQEPAATGQLEMRFKKGARYKLWCSLEGHEELGMKATLRVRRAAR
jgi:plastocyanin